ncbi:MAG: hypothetical protein H6Q73_2850 [Firmicutes bacterium]|nr:hypothetical protein [Bacillota bacterium]
MSQLMGKNMTPHIFGIRHLSPGGAYHLLKFLDEIKPTAVLIEGPADTNSQIEHFTAAGTELPIAVLAYTEELPVRTMFYPFAEYCPEYQALLWAKKNNVYAQFIDLPSEVFLRLEYVNQITPETPNGVQADQSDDVPQGSITTGEDRTESVYQLWAHLAGEDDHDTYWERNFEHNLNKDAYRLSASEFGRSLRELSCDSREEHLRTLLREAYMRSQIQNTIRNGHEPDKIVVITGAYHAPVLGAEYPPMTDEEFASLPRVKTKLTLMPYSYYRLSSRSGYGAGNQAPAYFAMMWNCLINNDRDRLSAEYLSSIVRYLRDSGTPRSAAEVIEGVRLANALAGLHSDSVPALQDLRDAAITCLGHGELSGIAQAIVATEVGTAIGRLPEGVSRTSIQDDFYRELKRLKLDKYRSAIAADLELDLRENRRVKSKEAAYLDLNRSFFLNRLKILNVCFQKKKSNKEAALWYEEWVLQWTPEAEIQLVEATLMGETIELATAYAFKERLDNSSAIADAAAIIRAACECGMPESMEYARSVLQKLAVDTGALEEIAQAVFDLSVVISYGDIRKFDSSHLIPLLEQLFLRGTLLLLNASYCDNNAAASIASAIHRLNAVALEHYTIVDEELWLNTLAQLAECDDRNPKLSGFACAILLERNRVSNEELSQEVARRLSPGIEADLGAGWFEGLSMRNRYALLTRMPLWQYIAEYVASLDNEQFKRALVFLRRAFGEFSLVEKRNICENLAEIWGINHNQVSEHLNEALSPEEEQTVAELNDFDFGDI